MADTIIFDADGVVIDSEPLWLKGTAEFLARRGFAYDKEKLMHMMAGGSIEEAVRTMQEAYGFEGDIRELARERREIVKELFEHGIRFVPGFEELYRKVRGEFKTCVATSLDRELLKVADVRLHLSRLFGKRIYTIADVGFVSKPDPKIFLYAAGKMGSKPGDCLVIEDSPRGIEGARRAGMKCIAITTTYGREKLAGADMIVDSFRAIDMDWLR